MSHRTHQERVLAGRAGAHLSWSRTPDRAARTENARQAFRDRFLDLVPAEITDPIERARAAEHLRKAHFAMLALKSAKARRLRAEAAALDAEVAKSELDGGDES